MADSAKDILMTHTLMIKERDSLSEKISKLEGVLYPMLIEEFDQLPLVEVVKVYRRIEDSDLKYRLFIYMKNRRQKEEKEAQ